MTEEFGLLDWLKSPETGKGFAFRREDTWSSVSFHDLAHQTWFAASRMRDSGLDRNNLVALALPFCDDFVPYYFGVVLAGGVVCTLPSPIAFRTHDSYIDQLSAIFLVARPRIIVTTPEIHSLWRQEKLELPPETTVLFPEKGKADDQRSWDLADIAMLQFTSGSIGSPKAVRVLRENLEANISAIINWLGWLPEDTGATWLPVYHDMGLVGACLAPLVRGSNLWVMQPEQFIRRPLTWLECFGQHGATLGPMPGFALGFMNSRLSSESLQELDFRSWRVAIVGAERIDGPDLDTFARLLEPFGFDRSALLPAYGLAESTLAVTGDRLSAPPRLARIDWSRVVIGDTVPILQHARLGEANLSDGHEWVVSCGTPLVGTTVTIENDSGVELPSECLGEVIVKGSSVTQGYEGQNTTETKFTSLGLRTGDVGFLSDGELFVLGRLGDSLKVRGRAVFAEDLEIALRKVDSKLRRFAVITGIQSGDSVVVTIIEAGSYDNHTLLEVATVLLRLLGAEVQLYIATVPKGTIIYTSSGKPKRRKMWEMFVSGDLPGETLDVGQLPEVHNASSSST